MFVPSLSWQKDRCYIKMVNKMYRFPHLRVDIAPVSGCSLTPLAGDRGEPRCSGRWAPGKRGVVATATQGCVSITPCRDKTRQATPHKHTKRILGSQLSSQYVSVPSLSWQTDRSSSAKNGSKNGLKRRRFGFRAPPLSAASRRRSSGAPPRAWCGAMRNPTRFREVFPMFVPSLAW
jgi:hypothetical protein